MKGRLIHLQDAHQSYHDNETKVACILWDGHAENLLTVGLDNTILIHSYPSFSSYKHITLCHHKGAVMALAINSNVASLAFGSVNHSVKLHSYPGRVSKQSEGPTILARVRPLTTLMNTRAFPLHNSFQIDFHDTRKGCRVPSMIDYFGFTMDSLSESGGVFGSSQKGENNPTTLMYRPFNSSCSNMLYTPVADILM